MKKFLTWLAVRTQTLRAGQDGLSNAAIVFLILLAVFILSMIFARPVQEYVISQWK